VAAGWRGRRGIRAKAVAEKTLMGERERKETPRRGTHEHKQRQEVRPRAEWEDRGRSNLIGKEKKLPMEEMKRTWENTSVPKGKKEG